MRQAGDSFGAVLPGGFVSVCDIETSKNSNPSLSLAAAEQIETNIKFTYRHSNCH
jgi:hypothetical protein